jgi:hypothetical protein
MDVCPLIVFDSGTPVIVTRGSPFNVESSPLLYLFSRQAKQPVVDLGRFLFFL